MHPNLFFGLTWGLEIDGLRMYLKSPKSGPRNPVIFSDDDWGVQSPPKCIVFSFHYHSQKVIGSLGWGFVLSGSFSLLSFLGNCPFWGTTPDHQKTSFWTPRMPWKRQKLQLMYVLPHQHCGDGPLVFQMARCTWQLNGELLAVKDHRFLGGGFKYLLFRTLLGEMIQFD